MTDRELMQQALEALEQSVSTCFDQYSHHEVMSRPEHFMNRAIKALRERLAQPQTRVGEMEWHWGYERGWDAAMNQKRECVDAVNTSQEESELTRLRQVCRNVYEVWAGSEGVPVPETCVEGYLLHLIEQMRDEAKAGLSEKPPVKSYCGGKPNYCTPVDVVNISQERVDETAKREHEPVAFVNGYFGGYLTITCFDPTLILSDGLALYTAPPKREWVGLTDEDFYGQSELQVMAMKYAEAKLKEKNGG